MKKYKEESEKYLNRLREDIGRIDHEKDKMSDSLVKKHEELKDKGSEWFYFEYVDRDSYAIRTLQIPAYPK